VGDASFQKKSLNKMISVTQSGCTILYVSHSMGSVKQFCQTVIWLESGKVVMQGNSSDITSYYLSKSLPQEGATMARSELVADPSKPVQIRKVVVLDRNGNSVDFIDLNEEFIIQIDYDFRESLEYIAIGCEIISDENQMQTLVSMSDPELDAKRLAKRQIGYYQSQIVIPAKILNVGSYRVRVGVAQLGTLSNAATVLDVVDNVSFWVTDKIGIIKHMGYERKNSMLSMQLPWEANLLENPQDVH
jgi:ABC-type glutathione transport system ATPase component